MGRHAGPRGVAQIWGSRHWPMAAVRVRPRTESCGPPWAASASCDMGCIALMRKQKGERCRTAELTRMRLLSVVAPSLRSPCLPSIGACRTVAGGMDIACQVCARQPASVQLGVREPGKLLVHASGGIVVGHRLDVAADPLGYRRESSRKRQSASAARRNWAGFQHALSAWKLRNMGHGVLPVRENGIAK